MVSPERQWNIRVDVLDHPAIVVRVSVDAIVLEPVLDCGAPEEALTYVDSALVDFRRGDCVTGLLCSADHAVASCVVPTRDMALNWLAPALIEAWHAVRGPARARSRVHTGVHAILEESREPTAPVRSASARGVR